MLELVSGDFFCHNSPSTHVRCRSKLILRMRRLQCGRSLWVVNLHGSQSCC